MDRENKEHRKRQRSVAVGVASDVKFGDWVRQGRSRERSDARNLNLKLPSVQGNHYVCNDNYQLNQNHELLSDKAINSSKKGKHSNNYGLLNPVDRDIPST